MHRCDPTRPEALLGGASHAMPPPERLLDLLPLCPTLVIGDIGRGPGFLALSLAARVPQGHVHVVDIAPTMRDTVRDRAAAGRANITMHLARSGVVPLPPGCLDGALLTLAFLFLPVAERVGFLARLRTLVRPGAGWLSSNGSADKISVLAPRWRRASPRRTPARRSLGPGGARSSWPRRTSGCTSCSLDTGLPRRYRPVTAPLPTPLIAMPRSDLP